MSSCGGPRAWNTALCLVQGSRMGFTKHTLKRAVIAVMIVLLVLSQGYTSALADSGPPWAGTTLDDLSYTEREGWKRLDTGVTVSSNTNDFTDGYVEVAISGGTSYDQLRLVSGGSLSVSGDAVYWSGDRIGTIDNAYNGSNGRLRVNFSAVAPLANADFEAGTLAGWTVDSSNNQMWGQSWAEGPIGYPNNDSDPAYDDWRSGAGTATVTTAAKREGNYGLKLDISGWVDERCGTAHSPSVESSAFSAEAGDTLSLYWSAAKTGDYYDVFGFVKNAATGHLQTLFHETGSTTGGWQTLNTSISTAVCPSGTCDDLHFVFINGTYDQTCGRYIGSYLYIDGINLQISSTTVANENIVSSVVEHIEYQNTSYDPDTTRQYNLNFRESGGSTGFNTAQINITLINEPPTISGTPAVSVDEGSPYSFTPTASDPNDDPLTFDIQNRPSWPASTPARAPSRALRAALIRATIPTSSSESLTGTVAATACPPLPSPSMTSTTHRRP